MTNPAKRPATLSIQALLTELGYGHPNATELAITTMAQASLVNLRRDSIDASKRDVCAATLATLYRRLCDNCATSIPDLPPDPRIRVPVANRSDCEDCRGSANRSAIKRLAARFRQDGRKRLVVVGGSPGVCGALKDEWPDDLELRVVDGTKRNGAAAARGDLAWADVVVIWASSELHHTVSGTYMARGPDRSKVIIVHKRGVESLAEALLARRDMRH